MHTINLDFLRKNSISHRETTVMFCICFNIANPDGTISEMHITFEDATERDTFCHELEHEKNLSYSNVLAIEVTQK